MLSWIFIVLANWNNGLRIHMSPHLDTLSRFRAKQSLLFLLSAACLAEKQQINSIHGYDLFIVIVNKIYIDSLHQNHKFLPLQHNKIQRYIAWKQFKPNLLVICICVQNRPILLTQVRLTKLSYIGTLFRKHIEYVHFPFRLIVFFLC